MLARCTREQKLRRTREAGQTSREGGSSLLEGGGCLRHLLREGHLLDQLNATELQDVVRYLCCVEKRGKGDALSSHGKSKKTLKARIAEVKTIWTKYFQLAPVAEEEEGGEEEVEVEESDEEVEIEVMSQRRKSRRLSSISDGENE